MTHNSLFINGAWHSGSGQEFHSTNPATGETIWSGNGASLADVNRAMASARRAFPTWANLKFEQRLDVLDRFRLLLERDKTKLAEGVSREMGKPLWDATAEITSMIGKLAVSVNAYHERTGEKHADNAGMHTVLRHRPHGVVAVYGPYNFPAHLPNGHILAALLAGNVIMYKPSEQTPAISEHIVRLWEEAGIPAGVMNLIQGEREAGVAIATHPDLDGLYFTGSSATGELLHQQFAGQTGKILALELGGNNPLVVHECSDLKAAAYIAILSAYMSSGQRCSCARRLILPVGKEGDTLIETLASMMGSIAIGPYTDTPEPYMGPMINNREADKIIAAQQNLIALGGRPVVELKRLHDTLPFLSNGLIDVTNIKDLPDREYFGPLLQIIRTPDFDTAMQEANKTQFGLTSALLSDNRANYDRFLQNVRAGVINFNRQTTGASASAPFGGLGKSGNHRPCAYYAADYCAYPVASIETDKAALPDKAQPGITW